MGWLTLLLLCPHRPQPWGDVGGAGRHTPRPPPQVALQCLWSIKIVVLVKPEHERRISHVHTSSVKTGIANTLGRDGDRVEGMPQSEGAAWGPSQDLRDPPQSSVLSTSLQGTRELWASPSSSMGPPLVSSTATWPLAVRRHTGDGGMWGGGSAPGQAGVSRGWRSPRGCGVVHVPLLSPPGRGRMRLRCPGEVHAVLLSPLQA